MALDRKCVLGFHPRHRRPADRGADFRSVSPAATGSQASPTIREKAKELLAKANCRRLEMEAVFPGLNVYGVDLSLLMQKVQQDLAKVNVKLELPADALRPTGASASMATVFR